MKYKFKLGDKLEDTVTGFKGTAEARIEWLNGCKQYSVQPKVDKEGRIPEACFIDEQTLVRLKEKKIEITKDFNGGARSFHSKYNR